MWPVLVADLLSVAAPSVCTWIVAGVDAFPLGPLGIDLALDLDFLLLEGGVVASPPVDDDGSGGWGGFRQLGCRVVS